MKVYYNKSCSICKAEIDLYKKQNCEDIEWVDITNNSDACNETFRSEKKLLRRLHVSHEEKIYEGVDAFLMVWKRIPKYRILYKIFNKPIIYTLFKIFYEMVAFFLYLKNKKQLKTSLK